MNILGHLDTVRQTWRHGYKDMRKSQSLFCVIQQLQELFYQKQMWENQKRKKCLSQTHISADNGFKKRNKQPWVDFIIIFHCHNHEINVRMSSWEDLSVGTFGLLKNVYSTVNIYRYVQRIIDFTC